MENKTPDNSKYNNDLVALFETTFRKGKLAGKSGYSGVITAEQYNQLVGKMGPGSKVLLFINEYKKERKHPQFRMAITAPPEAEQTEGEPVSAPASSF